VLERTRIGVHFEHTLEVEKNWPSSVSVRSKARFPTKAVYGGCEGKAISSRIGGCWRSADGRN
jgi:hypothetical protein